MQQSNRELWLAFIAVLLISIFYLFVVITLGGIPAASEFFGHSLGILGFLLMLMTETVYSLRKRSRSARWGRMASWLQFHIFTGLVGPYLVLLHSSWKFNGLAGIVMLLTGIIVASGFIGRYIYTAVPRTADGLAVEAKELENEIRNSEAELQKRMDPKMRAEAIQLEQLVIRRKKLQRQVTSLAQARRWLALWHSFHIPIGMVLFTAACIHIVAAVYYATLLR
ncbi:MAG TPA: hypothetical protein VIK64_15135 [Anaerolineales bacterium]|jgi:hypothetical protein